jgi:hypothetical protein
MHPWILGVAFVAAGEAACGAGSNAALTAPASCPAATAAVLERFIDANCDTCWTDASVEQAGARQWLLDWIVPSARGDEAPLSPAAPAESAARARRVSSGALPDGRTTVLRTPARTASTLRVRVVSGPAWSGYFAVQVNGSGRVAPGATAWIALVETVAPGTDGSAVPRHLVRTVAGPLEPAELRNGKPWQLLQAMRWPETAKPVRLRARAWIEQHDGRIVAMAADRCDDR